MKAALGYEYGCAGLRIWLHRVKDMTASMVYAPPVHRVLVPVDGYIGGKTKCVKMNESLNQWKAL